MGSVQVNQSIVLHPRFSYKALFIENPFLSIMAKIVFLIATVVILFASIELGVSEVKCGGHYASSCSSCPQGIGESWCNGDWVGACQNLPMVEVDRYQGEVHLQLQNCIQAVVTNKKRNTKHYKELGMLVLRILLVQGLLIMIAIMTIIAFVMAYQDQAAVI